MTIIVTTTYRGAKRKNANPMRISDLTFVWVVPPGIEPFASVYSNSLSDCTFFALSFMKTIELALR